MALPRCSSCRGGPLSGLEMAPRFVAGSGARSSWAVPREQTSPASLSPLLACGFGTPRLRSAILSNPPVGSADPRCLGCSRGSGGSRNRLPATRSESPLAAPASGWAPPPLLHMRSRPSPNLLLRQADRSRPRFCAVPHQWAVVTKWLGPLSSSRFACFAAGASGGPHQGWWWRFLRHFPVSHMGWRRPLLGWWDW